MNRTDHVRVPLGDSPGELVAFARDHLTRLCSPLRLHPDTATIEADVRAWAVARGHDDPASVRCLERPQVGYLVSACMPDAPIDVIVLAARYLGWLFMFDGQVMENAALVDSYLALAPADVLAHGRTSGAEPEGRHFLATLLDLRGQIVRRGGAALLPELAEGLAGYLAACAREAPWRVNGRVPALVDYLRDRTATAGGHTLLLHRLALTPGTTSVPSHPRLSPELADLAEQVSLIGGLANDLISWRFETDHADPVNLVTVIAHQYRLDPADAFRAAVVVYAAIKHQFDLRCARLAAAPGRCDPALLTAITGWVNGCVAIAETYWQDDQRQYGRATKRPPERQER